MLLGEILTRKYLLNIRKKYLIRIDCERILKKTRSAGALLFILQNPTEEEMAISESTGPIGPACFRLNVNFVP